MPLFRRTQPAHPEDSDDTIDRQCQKLKAAGTQRELGGAIARIVLAHSPADIQRMKRTFETKVQDLTPDYRERLTAKITEHLLGTFQKIRLYDQQGTLKTMTRPVTDEQRKYWDMAACQCSNDGSGDAPNLRFLKYLLSGFCMLVLDEPGHPVGTPFPGGDTVQKIDGIWYCPVREKAGDVDSALCPYCPARQTPGIGYLRPPVNGSDHRKQEFIDNCYRYHNFNG
jgi:uncharacterized protein (UPF0305 family)